jgi:two-component system response regulator MprA
MLPAMTAAGAKQRILIVEDEPGIVDVLEMGLRHEGFDVESAPDGEAGWRAFAASPPALVILDLMLPGVDGMELCRRIRARSDVPIVMLTARGDVDSRIDGFAAGADDYIPKPFRFEELLARVRAVLRRADPQAAGELAFADVRLSLNTREVTRAGQPVALTAREFDLLALFMRQPRQVFSKEVILSRVWGADFYGDANVVEVYIRYLRRKLGEPMLIHTLRGAGYALRDAPAQEIGDR